MLKLDCTSFDLWLEWVDTPSDIAIADRAKLAVRTGGRLSLERGQASLLLNVALPGVKRLEDTLRSYISSEITIDKVDEDCVEVTFKGHWIGTNTNPEAGIFMANLDRECERLIFRLWKLSQRKAAYQR
ncbi:MAG: alr0857 family protein [Cyanobacteria bacterium P01_D01_bin.156]